MMYDSWVSFGADGTESFDRALQGLERIPQVMADRIQRVIVDELESLAAEARAKLLSEATHGLKQTGLRARIAAGVNVETFDDDSGRGAKVTSTAPAGDMMSIPWGLDSASHGWKHPVFGKENDWVTEIGTLSWWHDTMQKAQPDLEEAIPEAMDAAVEETFG